ncbi:MAG: pyridoxal phosphate-dependent aminotransferase [Clostridiales bacterium]|nr:pyridoxal phosphate-dependent aminotransferase [Candidatus Scatonaster coprocaballi]
MISKEIEQKLSGGSLIRKMFDEGTRLKKIYGDDKVFDFSIGNPDLEPPKEVKDAIKELAEADIPGMHGYMANAGYPETRQAIADQLSKESGLSIGIDSICMSCGAASGMNNLLRSIMEPGDEIILLAPFFLEYMNYISNVQGKPIIVNTDPVTFQPIIADIEKAITPKTKAIIINSPNNPSGAIYPKETLLELNAMLLRQDHVIHVISDEPYKDLAYDGMTVPSTLSCFDNLIVCFSWSKSLSLPGERIGYTCVSPKHADFALLTSAIVLCNRILGSVNAPAFMQRVVAKSLTAKVDVANYERRRNLLYNIITEAGFTCTKPNGALYIFMKTPIEDNKFCEVCAKYNVLVVPGSAFKREGYVRLAFCVSEKTIHGSKDAFEAIAKELNLK